MNSQKNSGYILSVSRLHFIFREFTIDSLFYSRIHFESSIFFRELSMNSLSLSRINYNNLIVIAKLLWILYLFCEFTLNSLSFLRINYEVTIIFVNKLWIHDQSCQCTMNSLFCAFTISFAKILWIYHLYTNSL